MSDEPPQKYAALKQDAALIRQRYLPRKPLGKGNVALAEIQIPGRTVFCAGATSRGGRKSPIPDRPMPRSQGGQFEPTVDPSSGRVMDTDAEYKVLSEIAATLEMIYDRSIEGTLHLYSELQPCSSCEGVIAQFKEKFPKLNVVVFWDLPFPP